MRLFLPLILLGLSACHLPAYGRSYPDSPRRGGYDDYDRSGEYATLVSSRSLQAAVWYDEYSGETWFEINRPAHVALFALQPMGVVELIYPRYGDARHGRYAGRAFRAGQHSVRTLSTAYRLAGYGSRYAGARGGGATYIVLIASDRPFRFSGFDANGIHPWLSQPAVTSNPFLATDRLAREIIPRPSSPDWTSAYYVTWPDTRFRRYDGRVPHTRVVCPGGFAIRIPAQALRSGWYQCPAYNGWRDGYYDPYRDRYYDPYDRGRRDTVQVRTPRVTDQVTRPRRPDDWRGATPTRDRGGEIVPDGRRVRPVGRRPTPSDPGPGSTPSEPLRPERPTPPEPAERPARAERPERAGSPVIKPTREPAQPRPRRPAATPRQEQPARRPSTPVRPTRAVPASRPQARPAPASRPAAKPAPRPEARPTSRPRPQARPKPAPRPESRPRPSAVPKKKKKNGGG